MQIGNYEIMIISDNPGVHEVDTANGPVWVGVPAANYRVRIKNNDADYRIFAHIFIDGQEVMESRWGLLAKPGGKLTWDGWRIDDNTVREFVFTEDDIDSVAAQQGNIDRLGYIDIKITKEKEEWEILNPPSYTISFLSTTMGGYKESNVQQAKIKFKHGGPIEKVTIRYGTEDQLKKDGIL